VLHDRRVSRYACRECGLGAAAAGACGDCGGAIEGSDDPLIGTVVARYRIARAIGSGGMGRVYLAVQPEIGSRVAIKILTDDFAGDRAVIERFFAEARTVNLIRHDGIVNVIDLDRLADGRPFIVMEFLDGRTLRDLASSGPVSLDVVVPTIVDVLLALDAAHAAGVVHRDLKPDNVIVTQGRRVKVLDFGIAKLVARPQGQARTRTGAAIGTPEYMAPEQILGLAVDPRTDVYAAGVMLYELATGRRPFGGANDFELMEAHLRHPHPRVRDVRPDLPQALDDVIAIALAKRPDDRFPTARAMARALRAVSTSTTIPLDDERHESAPRDGRLNEPTRSLHDRPADPAPRAEATIVDRPAPKRHRRARRGLVLAGVGIACAIAATIALVAASNEPTPVATATSVDAAVVDAPVVIAAAVDAPVATDATTVAASIVVDSAHRPPRVVDARPIDARPIDARPIDARPTVARPPPETNDELWDREVTLANKDKFEPTEWVGTALGYLKVVETDLEITEIFARVRDDGTAFPFSTSYSFISPRALAAGDRIPCAFVWLRHPQVGGLDYVRYGRSGGCRRKRIAGKPKCGFADIVPEKVMVHPEATEVDVTWSAAGWTVVQNKSFPIDAPKLSERTVPDDCP
jgi:serine/threonine protein kinase